jgi:hypothetical protein
VARRLPSGNSTRSRDSRRDRTTVTVSRVPALSALIARGARAGLDSHLSWGDG